MNAENLVLSLILKARNFLSENFRSQKRRLFLPVKSDSKPLLVSTELQGKKPEERVFERAFPQTQHTCTMQPL